MKLTSGRYAVIIFAQTLLFLVDFGINAFALFNHQNNAIMLILFIAQDACLILAISALLLMFFSTYVFQSGLMDLLYERFRTTLLVCVFYFILTTVIHIWALIARWNNSFRHTWSIGFLIMFIVQRLMATIYYYFYKRAALRISDPRFYEDLEFDHGSKKQNGQLN